MLPTLTWGAWPLSQSPVSRACVRGGAGSREAPDQASALRQCLRLLTHSFTREHTHGHVCVSASESKVGVEGRPRGLLWPREGDKGFLRSVPLPA